MPPEPSCGRYSGECWPSNSAATSPVWSASSPMSASRALPSLPSSWADFCSGVTVYGVENGSPDGRRREDRVPVRRAGAPSKSGRRSMTAEEQSVEALGQSWPEPPVAGDETATLLGSLERQRATFAWKCAGLDAAGLQTKLGPSALTLGGLLKHL